MKEQMTITEALAEIKLIEKKVEKKKQVVSTNLARITPSKDLYESEGGSQVAMRKEVQSIQDLENRLVRIREAIAVANVNTQLTLVEETKSLYAWITWKREVAEKQATFYKSIYEGLKNTINNFNSRPQVYKDGEDKTVLAELVPNVDYAEFVTKSQKTSDLIETLDGKLSLKNATTTITI